MVREAPDERSSGWMVVCAIAAKLCCTSETLRKWVRQIEQGLERGLDRPEFVAHAGFLSSGPDYAADSIGSRARRGFR